MKPAPAYPCEVCGRDIPRTGKAGRPRQACEGACTEFKHRLAQLETVLLALGPRLDKARKAGIRSELWGLANNLNG